MTDEKQYCEDCDNELELVPGKEEKYACRYCFGWLIGTQRRRGVALTESPFDEQNNPFELPTYRGYTVDFRTKQFRKVTGVDDKRRIEFIDFDEVKGKALLVEMRAYFGWLYQDYEGGGYA